MVKAGRMIATMGAAVVLASCGDGGQKAEGDFKYLIDEFADLKIMRYRIPGWDRLSLQQKEYVYHLGEAAKYGRDIIWAQNCEANLPVRKAVETIIGNYDGDRECDEYQDFLVYAKRLFLCGRQVLSGLFPGIFQVSAGVYRPDGAGRQSADMDL